MNRTVNPSSLYLDMITSHLRSQIVALHNVLETIERTHVCEDDYIRETMKTAENEIRRLRKYMEN